MGKTTMRFAYIGGIALALGYGSIVYGAGFAIIEQSVKSIGNAVAGGSAVAEDASTIFFNPAGLARLPGQQAEAALHVIIPQADFSDQDSTNAIGTRTSGNTSDDAGEVGFVPNLYYANEIISQKLWIGLGINAPFGLATEYDRDWIGRYHAVKSELKTIDVNPSAAYRINNRWSVGVGVNAMYVDAELTNAIDFGTLGFLAGAPGAQASNPAFDGFSKVEGDDWAYGYNIGVLYELERGNGPAFGSRLGLHFRSKLDVTLTGDQTLTVPDVALAIAGLPTNTVEQGAKASVTLPASVSLSGYHQLTPDWAIMADVTWTDWSQFEELRIRLEDGRESVQPENWKDSWRYSLGANYFYDDEWTLRAGVAYDETPIRSAEERTPRIPGNSRTWVALGASYRPSPQFSFDIGYAHLFINDTRIDDTEVTTGALAGVPVGNTLRGEYDASVDILSAQVQWNF